ncbi:MAG: efflux RND transporter permease subunit [Chitinispirillaceae bacterium]|nr:efflux RND transporter permease subunit [Chitinispirillaceae bacterium]
MIKLLVNKASVVFSAALLIIIMGVLSYIQLPRESTPEIKQPYIFITTLYPGVAAGDVENLVTRVIEDEIDGVEGLIELTSSSQQSLSFIFTKFASNISVEAALRKVQERVDRAKTRLPDETEEPSVQELSTSSFPILYVSLSHPDGLKPIDKTAEELQKELRRVKGVLDVDIAGNLEKEVAIELDPAKLDHYGLSINDVVMSIQFANIAIPGGTLKSSTRNYSIAINSEIRDAAFFEDIIVKSGPVKVPLREIGTVAFKFAEQKTFSRFNGAPAITLTLTKRSGENIIHMVDDARELIDEKVKAGAFPQGTRVAFPYDESNYIRQIIADLENNMFTGFILVLAVTIFFLGIVNSLFVSLAIPFSMMLSFFILDMLGITLNMVVLFSLILALGMLVDNGIVIVENIFRHGSMGKTVIQASIDGASEVAAPIFTSTLTTLMAFFPIIFMPDVMGDFMKYVPITVIVVLSSSLAVALTINPVFCSRFMHISEKNQRKITQGSGFFARLQGVYQSILTFSIRNAAKILLLCVVVVFTGFYLYFTFGKEIIFFPSVDPSDAIIAIEMPQGTPLAKTDSTISQIEELVRDVPMSLKNIQSTTGKAGDGDRFGGVGEEFNKGSVRLSFTDFIKREIKGRTAIDSIKARLKHFTGAETKVLEQEMGPPSGHDISYDIVGDDYKILGAYSDTMLALLGRYPELKTVESDFETAKPEIAVSIDRLKAAYYGMSVQEIASTIRNSMNGASIGKFRQGEEEFDIVIRYGDRDRNAVSDISRLHIVNKDGDRIPLSELASITSTSAVGVIKRRELRRSVGVWGDFKPGTQNKTKIQAEVDSLVHQIRLPKGYAFESGQGFEMREEATNFLIKAFIIAVFLIGIILIAQFNSILQMIIILTSVFLSMGGVFWGYYLSGQEFIVIMSGIGCIALAGVAVNNGIILVDYTNILVRGGMPPPQAVVEAGKTRLRPVLLTAITTVLGLLPMAFGISIDIHPGTAGIQVGSEMSEFWRAFAWATVYGLAFATVMTLVMVPCMLSVYFKLVPPKAASTPL